MKNTKMQKLSSEELYAFSDEMSMMLMGGISSYEAITLLLEETEDAAEKEFLAAIQETVLATSSLAAGIEDSGLFPDYYVQMLAVGEQTGKTDEVLASLSRHYQRDHQIKQAIRNAISYPMLMVAMMLVIIIVLVTQIMPIFERVFQQLGSSMTGISAGLLSMGEFLSSYGAVFLLILVIIAVVIGYMAMTEKGKARLKAISYRIKAFRRIQDKIAISRFASGIAMTMGSGMDLLQAVEVTRSLIDAMGFDEKVERLKADYMEHADMGQAFSVSGIFTGLYGRMVVLAVKTGNMEQVMEKIADIYQDEADDEIHSLINMVEPTLVIVLSVIVGLILLSVMLPLLGIMSGIN